MSSEAVNLVDSGASIRYAIAPRRCSLSCR
jgi:hypothetical protein